MGNKLQGGDAVCINCLNELGKVDSEVLFKLKNYSKEDLKSMLLNSNQQFEPKEQTRDQIIGDVINQSAKSNRMNEIIVTTGDLKQEYDVIGPVYFQVSNKGLFSSALSKLTKKYMDELQELKRMDLVSREKLDWGWLYGEYSFGMQNDFDKAFFVAVKELQQRARILGADAVIGMKQDIDMDTMQFQYFYFQMYGTAVKFK
ncbi:MAG: heavy metal-binding domain-containing protein [Mangrovibacterium sp.]